MRLRFRQDKTVPDYVARLRTTKVTVVGHRCRQDYLSFSDKEKDIVRIAIHEAEKFSIVWYSEIEADQIMMRFLRMEDAGCRPCKHGLERRSSGTILSFHDT